MHHQIPPHGGELVNRVLTGEKRDFWVEKAASLPAIAVDRRTISDIEMIASGAMSPLEGFMCRDDYNHVVDMMRLESGLPWPLPIVLGVSHDQADMCDVGSQAAITDRDGATVAILHLQEKYVVNKEKEAARVYHTTDPKHPGVRYLLEERGDVLLGGDIDIVNLPAHVTFNEYRLTPLETRHAFEQHGWSRIVAFQTRNPLHRIHEELTKRAADEIGGSLLIHPVVGLTRPGDVDHYTRVRIYKTMVERYYDQSCTLLSLLPLAMRLAGPKEAVWHAIIRRNYGASHFIIGRDHAGPGKDSHGRPFYGPYEAQAMMEQYAAEVGVTPMEFKELVYVCLIIVT